MSSCPSGLLLSQTHGDSSQKALWGDTWGMALAVYQSGRQRGLMPFLGQSLGLKRTGLQTRRTKTSQNFPCPRTCVRCCIGPRTHLYYLGRWMFWILFSSYWRGNTSLQQWPAATKSHSQWDGSWDFSLGVFTSETGFKKQISISLSQF